MPDVARLDSRGVSPRRAGERGYRRACSSPRPDLIPSFPRSASQEAQRIIGRIASVIDEQHLLVIGGQAIVLCWTQLAAGTAAESYSRVRATHEQQSDHRDGVRETVDR